MPRVKTAEPAVALTNVAKVMYPDSGFSKGAMLDYYRQISPHMLPHLQGRPVTVVRYPDGVGKGFFYEKRCPLNHPDFVVTANVRSKEHGTIQFCEVDNQASLMWLANRAAIEFHSYLFRSSAQDHPTMMVIDLDPGDPAGLKECLTVSLILRDALAAIGLQSFVKTSGSKGLHLGVPIHQATFASSKELAHQLARLLAQRYPDKVTDSMSKAQRPGRVFLDWSQNDHGKTTASAYSLRARTQPTVSTPISWDELSRALRRGRPEDLVFTAPDVLERVKKFGDLFAPTLTMRQRIPRFSPTP